MVWEWCKCKKRSQNQVLMNNQSLLQPKLKPHAQVYRGHQVHCQQTTDQLKSLLSVSVSFKILKNIVLIKYLIILTAFKNTAENPVSQSVNCKQHIHIFSWANKVKLKETKGTREKTDPRLESKISFLLFRRQFVFYITYIWQMLLSRAKLTFYY